MRRKIRMERQKTVPEKMMVYIYFSECTDRGKVVEGAETKIKTSSGKVLGTSQ